MNKHQHYAKRTTNSEALVIDDVFMYIVLKHWMCADCPTLLLFFSTPWPKHIEHDTSNSAVFVDVVVAGVAGAEIQAPCIQICLRMLCLLLSICIVIIINVSVVCSRNVMASYQKNTSLVTQDAAYSTIAKNEYDCKESCISADVCRYMWWAPDGVCRLYDINTTASTIGHTGHATLIKLCGGKVKTDCLSACLPD